MNRNDASNMEMILTVNPPYDFARSVTDYGWIALAPNRWDPETSVLQRVERLSTGTVVLVNVFVASASSAQANGTASGDDAVSLSVDIQIPDRVTGTESEELSTRLRWMLRLSEDLRPFYRRARRDPRLWSAVSSGRGRLLRSSTLFEDVVKTICTTNTTWHQTKGMVQRLVELLGSPCPTRPGLHAFPTPKQVASADPETLHQKVRLGYRSDYVHQLAREIVSGQRELESLREDSLSPVDLRKQLRSIKGVGEYATNTLLMSMGHYDDLAMDSEMRAFVSTRYHGGRPVSDDEIATIYEKWGRWKYLAYWFDLIA
jgi:3-methyladenine DNA glycosylase/8-oxoguanine DNA glycosylase